MVSKTLFNSATGEWETPQDLFDELNKEFNFKFDLAANNGNKKCAHFYTIHDDSLSKDWRKLNGWLWLNPPYGRNIGQWVEKAFFEKEAKIVMLLPARTDTKWFHEYIYDKANIEIRFIRGRLKFGGSTNSAPFPSMLVIFK
jgi:phage N-6-adenine-methyltransferase